MTAAGFVGSASAAVILDPGKITTGSLTGTGLIIDTPSGQGTSPPIGTSDWTEDADDGFEFVSPGSSNEQNNKPGWEPDGTVDATDDIQRFANGVVTYTFDIADGSVINAVYADWGSQGNTPGADYSYSEGAASGTVSKSHTSGSTGDLVVQWTDSLAVVRSVNFESLFTGPITVAGGDGFTITVDGDGSFFWHDAVIIDYTAIPEPGAPLLLRRRR